MHQLERRTGSKDRPLAGLEWGDVMAYAAAAGASICHDEVNDVCLLLMLADRVFIPRPGRKHSAAQWLSCVLHELGIPVELLDPESATGVQPTDTVLAILPPDDSPALTAVLQSSLDKSPVLLLIAADANEQLLRQADAAVIIIIPRMPTADISPIGRRASRAQFELMSVVCVDAVARNLSGRLERHNSSILLRRPTG